MNKGFLLSILGLFLVLAFSLTVNATAEIAYKYNVNDVTVEAFNCLDESCSTVSSFSGTLPDGNSTTNSQLRIFYPTDLATPNGYVVFHFAKGNVPIVSRAMWEGNGVSEKPEEVSFSKIKTCRSVVDTFSVTNDAKPNIPLVFNVSSSLDATTRSAFKLNNLAGFVPDSYSQDFFSSDVKVSLLITDTTGAKVNEQVQEFKAANGTAIRADQSVRTEFSWTPDKTGRFTAIVTSEVTDDQCENTDQQASAKMFDVLAQEPVGECYTLLNDLAATNPNPKVGEIVKVSFSKISNHADSSGVLTSLPTNVSYLVTDKSGNVLLSKTETLAANSDNVAKTTHEFEFTALREDNHIISVKGNAESSKCDGLTNRQESIAQLLFISEKKTFSLDFKLVDSSTGQPVEDAEVKLTATNFDETEISDEDGELVFEKLEPGTYNYEITHEDFKTLTGSVVVTDADVHLTLTLERNIQPPESNHAVSFVVEHSETNKPVSGAFVEFSGKDAQSNKVSLAGFTDLDGELTFKDVKDGEYSFIVSHKDFLTSTGMVVLTSTTGDVEVQVRLAPGKQPPSEPRKEEVSLFVSSIRIPAAFESSPGDRLELLLNFENNGNSKLENIRATATILELGARGSSGPFDLKPGDGLTRRLLVDLPEDTEPGNYVVRVTLSNDKTSRVLHREVEVN